MEGALAPSTHWVYNATMDMKQKRELREQGLKFCNDCNVVKSLDDFYRNKQANNYHSICKSCFGAKTKKWADANPESRKKTYRKHHLKKRYGMSEGQHEAMLAEQGNACKACGSTDPKGRGVWHVDHDHSCCPGRDTCGKCVRGILCNDCNTALGLVEDDPGRLRKLIEYLEATQ